MTRREWSIVALIVVVVALWYVLFRVGLLGAGAAPETIASAAQAPQTHEAGYWKHFAKPVDGALRAKLSPLEYEVTQKDGTELPFQNAYWKNEEEGIYVDIVTGEPLFSSKDKFDSGTGWPSFT